MSTSPKVANPVRKHQREVLLRIAVPVLLPAVMLVALCTALGIAFAAGSVDSSQIAVAMSIVATVFIALPLAILCLIPYVLLVLAAYFGGRAYAHARTPLRAARSLSGQIAVKTDEYAPKLARPLIGLNARLTRWEYTLRGWQQPSLPAEKEMRDDE